MIHEKIEIQLKDSEFKANLFTYFLDNSPEIDLGRKRPVVLICPGGGYEMTSDRLCQDFQQRGRTHCSTDDSYGLSCGNSALQRSSGTVPGSTSAACHSSCNAS